MAGRPTVIVLAAGLGLRFRQSGGTTHKLAAPLAGATVLEHVLRAVTASGLPFYVVQPLTTVQGSAPSGLGMGDSIARGVQATLDSAGWLILPGDLPLVRPGSLQHVARSLRTSTVVVPQWQGQKGHPVGFAASCRPALLELSGDAGAAAVVHTHRMAGAVQVLELDDPGVVTDIDTTDDLARAQALWGALSSGE